MLNTASGLRPCYDSDYDEKKKLKLGKIYKAKITLARNYDNLKKYFPKSFTKQQMDDSIIKLLENWHRKREQEMER